MTDPTDWELIQRCKRGSEGAFDQLVDRYERLVYSIARRYGLVQDDAVDVAQQTFMLMIEQLDRFHADSNVKGWLGTVTRRNAWRVLSRYDHESVQAPDDLVEMGEKLGLAHSHNFDNAFVVDWLHNGLTQLDPRCQKLIAALYFAPTDPSYDEMAASLNIPKGSIGPTRKRCLEKLRKRLEAENTNTP